MLWLEKLLTINKKRPIKIWIKKTKKLIKILLKTQKCRQKPAFFNIFMEKIKKFVALINL